jgi:hypothetical protein
MLTQDVGTALFHQLGDNEWKVSRLFETEGNCMDGW